MKRPRWKAANYYDKLESFYDWIAGPFEWPKTKRGIALLDPHPGETILEIGCGTGRALAEIARLVGDGGTVFGMDISRNMVRAAKKRLKNNNLRGIASALREDALTGDYKDSTGVSSFDGIFMSFTLELFDTKEIPRLLRKLGRNLKNPGGRMVVISLQKTNSLPVRVYEVMHTLFPIAIDCRPIPLKELLEQNGFNIMREIRESITGIPVSIVKAAPFPE